MSEKLRMFKTTVFFEGNYYVGSQPVTQMEIWLPIEAISYLTIRERNNPVSGYDVHFKKSFLSEIRTPIKEINPAYLTKEQVEQLNK